MGVPAISLAGDRFASRLGCSVLSNAGLPHLVAGTPVAFARLAADLAVDLPRLAALRRGLRAQLSQSPLMDRGRFARAFEVALRRMAAGEPGSRGRPSADQPAALALLG
jgi:predicted O-linked N-acetylglucosamine transferase (SPINDLY family)